MQFSFNIPDAQVPRLREFLLSKTAPDDPPATDQELMANFRKMIRSWIKSEVQQYELMKEHEASYQNYTQIDVTD